MLESLGVRAQDFDPLGAESGLPNGGVAAFRATARKRGLMTAEMADEFADPAMHGERDGFGIETRFS